MLVVEDECIIALDLQRALLRHGYRVATAATGADALRLARELQPRIVLMDLQLRGSMDGVDAAQRLRAEFRFALIYLSSGGVGDLSAEKQTNPVALLDKPFTEAQLMAAVEVAEASLQRSSAAAFTDPTIATPLGPSLEDSMSLDASISRQTSRK